MAEKTQSATAAGEALRQAQEAADALARVLEQLNNLVRSEAQQRFQQLVAAATEQLSFVTNSFETLDRMVVEKGCPVDAGDGERKRVAAEVAQLDTATF